MRKSHKPQPIKQVKEDNPMNPKHKSANNHGWEQNNENIRRAF